MQILGVGSRSTENDFVVTSPDESETDFFPIKRSFFANNTANLTITDGVITSVDQTKQSELAAAVGLPATFIGSYMTAIGQLFSSLTSVSGDQQKLIQQNLATSATQTQATAVTSVQNRLCTKTLAGYDFSNMTTPQLSAAQIAVKAACPSN